MERAELEELRAERDRMMEEAARSLREAKECAEFTRLQAQQEYDTWRQSCEQGPREWAEERREMNLTMERQRDKLRKMHGEKLDLDMSYAEVERARAAAENAKEAAERDLARIRSDTQRVESETAFQRGYPPKGLSYRSEVPTWHTTQSKTSMYGRQDLEVPGVIAQSAFQPPIFNCVSTTSLHAGPRVRDIDECIARLEQLRLKSSEMCISRIQGLSTRPREERK